MTASGGGPAARWPVGILCGPTGSGKSALALALAAELPLEIISVDSAQVYRGLDIGTAKPERVVRERVPHHLLDLRDPAERYSAGEFVTDALAAIARIHARGRLPLLVGGTMLYLRALLRGLAALPRASGEWRAQLERRARAEGWSALHAELARVDPVAAARIHSHDPQRIQRALEVHALSGRPLSELQRQTRGALEQFQWFAAGLMPTDRTRLRTDLERRLADMLRAGFAEEVQGLYHRGDLQAELPAMRAVGYRQLWAWCAGRLGLAAASEQALIATAQLAKRQYTWLRSEPLYRPFDPQSGTCAAELRSFYWPALEQLQQLQRLQSAC